MADYGVWKGLEQSTSNMPALGMKIMEYNQRVQNEADQLALEKQKMDILQQSSDMAKQKAQYELDALAKQKREGEGYVPASFLDKSPELRDVVINKLQSAGYPYKQDPNGTLYVTGYGRDFLTRSKKEDSDFQLTGTQAIVSGLSNKLATLLSQREELLQSGAKPDDKKLAELDRQLGITQGHYAASITALEDVQKKIQEEKAKNAGQPVKRSAYEQFASGYGALLKQQHPDWSQEKIDLETSNEAQKRNIEKGVTISVAGADARGRSFGQYRTRDVFDKESGEIVPVDQATLADEGRKPPEQRRYLSGPAAEKAAKQINLIQDIKMNINSTRGSLTRLTNNFTEDQRLKLYEAVNATDPHSALGNLIHGQFGKSLTTDQVDYLTDAQVLIENAMAMRSVVGMGQGSDELRAAIRATVPGAGTFSKQYAATQLDKFDRTLRNLSRGIPGGKAIEKSLFGGNASALPSGATSVIRYDSKGNRIQ